MTGFGGAASGFVAGATAATGFLGGALVIAVLAVGLRAGDLATLALLAGAFVPGVRFAAIVFADFFAADFFLVFFAAATFFLFFAFFAIIVFPIVAADFPNHTGPISSGCNGTVRLSTQLRPVDCANDLALGAATVTITPATGFAIEAVLAFFLVTVVLSTAVAGRAGNLAPLAIGMTLTLNIIMGGALTGAAFNPARALGPMIATGKLTDAWLYVVAPIVGAMIAAWVHAGLTQLARERTTAAGPASVVR